MTPQQYQDAMRRGVVIYDPAPTPAQWDVIASDLACEPAGGPWWRRYGGVLPVVTAGPVTNYPTYSAYPPGSATVSGIGRPVPIVNADLAYPVTPNGVATGGVSVILHECGHLLNELMPRLVGQRGLYSDRDDWRRAVGSVRWWDAATDPDERWADGYAAWCLWLGGKTNRLNPAFLSGPYRAVRDYFTGLTRAAGWKIDPPNWGVT